MQSRRLITKSGGVVRGGMVPQELKRVLNTRDDKNGRNGISVTEKKKAKLQLLLTTEGVKVTDEQHFNSVFLRRLRCRAAAGP